MPDPNSGERRLAGMSAATWRTAARGPYLRSAMTGVFVLDRAPDPQLLRQRMERVTERFPALRSRVIESAGQLGRPRLVIDPDFDISLHMAHYVLPDPGSWQQVLQHARRYSLTDLDRDRALWRAVLLDGLQGGRSAAVLVVHHAIADGQGVVKIVTGLLDLGGVAKRGAATGNSSGSDSNDSADRPAAAMDSAGKALESGGGDRRAQRTARSAAKSLAKPGRRTADNRVRAMGRGMLRMAGSARRVGQVHSTPMSTLMTGRAATYTPLTLDISFPALRKFAKRHGGTLNDAFLTGLTAGVRIYHEACEAPAGKIRINVPVSFRDQTSRADDNTQVIVRIELDTAELDTSTRLAEAQQAMTAALDEPILTHMDLVAEATRLLPVDSIVTLSRGSDLTASNVPGVPMPVRLGGARVERIYPVVATLGAAANITLLSYAGKWCSIGVTVDDAAVPDPGLFVECLAQGFAEIGVSPVASPYDPLP